MQDGDINHRLKNDDDDFNHCLSPAKYALPDYTQNKGISTAHWSLKYN